MAKLNPGRDNQFEAFARVVEPSRKTFRERLMEALAAGLKGKDAIRAAKEADEFEDTFRLHDLGYGPAPAQDYDLSFNAPFYDEGNGVVDIRNTRTGVDGTFVRNSVASCRLSTGLLKKVSANVPRAHYLEDGTYGGYLTEGQRTNIVLRSEEFDNAYWTKLNATVSANAAVAPDGTTTADKIIDDATSGQHGVHRSITGLTAGQTCVQSVFAKAGEHSWLFMTEGNNVTASASFNLATGTVGTVAGTGSPSATIEAWGNGWYRCTLTFTPIDVQANIQVRAATADGGGNYSGDGASGIYAWGAQFEQNVAFASSYIPTTNVSVARAADDLTFPAGGLVYVDSGTFFAEVNSGPGASVSVVHRLFAVDDGTTNNRIDCRFVAGVLDCITVSGGVSNGSVVMDTPGVDNQNYKVAVSWGSRLVGVSSPGDGVATDSAYTNIATATHVGIGVSEGATGPLFGTIKSAQIWRRQMPDAALSALVA